jgi:PIN domain nuclease of toxin-antitoxin system
LKLLLDTCTFLWLTSDPGQVSSLAAMAIFDPSNECFLSAISAWEIGVAVGLRRVRLLQPVNVFVENQRVLHRIASLPFDERAAFHLQYLPRHHKDPFDRMVICQATVEKMTIATPDAIIAKYAAPVLW